MKKGFTLIELIGVIVILGILALLAFPNILKMITETENKLSDSEKTIIYSGVDSYIIDNKNDYPEKDNNVYCITAKELVSSDKIPTTSYEKILNSYVKATYKNGDYQYEIVEQCTSIE